MMTAAELEQLLVVGYETRSFEVKGPGSFRDKPFCAKIARALMAMGNLSGMGYVCLGIDEQRMKHMQPGLSDDEFEEWSNFDDVSAALARYSDPPVSFHLNPLTLSSGAQVVIFEMNEFDNVPYVCKRDMPGELQEGRVYVRPRGKPQSVPVPNASEMRELLDTATSKQVRELVRRMGLELIPARSLEEHERARFEDEATQVWAVPSSTVESILSHAYFDVSVRPTTFNRDRLEPQRLARFVVDNTVRLRGWPVPFTGRGARQHRFSTWVGEDLDVQLARHEEAWRMCTSGQFLHRRILSNERLDTARHPDVQPRTPAVTGAVVVWDVLLYAVEIAEFGARSAQALQLESIDIVISANGVAGRELVSGDRSRDLFGPYVFRGDTVESDQAFGTADLLARTREAGVQLAQGLLRPFGLDLPDQVLIDWQDQVFSRR